MKSFVGIATALLAVASPAVAFSSTSSFSGSQVSVAPKNNAAITMEYIPSGMSKAQWLKLKNQEKSKNKGKNLGASGITSFKSRTFAEWQKAGGVNLFPVDPKKVKDKKDLPYMQRPGGSADDSDLGKKKAGGVSFFNRGGKKKEEPKAAAPVAEKKNWWTM